MCAVSLSATYLLVLYGMVQVEEKAPFTSEVDDYHDEKREVIHDQGNGFPYTKGGL